MTQKGENELFETIVNGTSEAREVRIEGLSKLLSRHQFQDVTAVFHPTIVAARKWGMARLMRILV
jgi:hypothetical protein